MYIGGFVNKLNETMSQFGFRYLLTRSGFIPKSDEKITNEIYLPVIESLSNPKWKEANNYLKESFAAFRFVTPEGYSTSITKAVTAVQAFTNTYRRQDGCRKYFKFNSQGHEKWCDTK